MGLDVYLYRYDDFAKYKALTLQWNERTERLYANDVSDEERKSRRDAIARDMNLSIDKFGWPHFPGVSNIEKKSALHPDALFKVGYFRSSYNSGGFNTVCEVMLRNQGLYSIFGLEYDQHEYEVLPDWSASRPRAIQMIDDLKAKRGTRDNVFVFKSGPNPFENPEELRARCSNRDQAMQIYREAAELWDRSRRMNDYSSKKGDFFRDGIQVVALVAGVNLNKPCVYVIAKSSEEALQHYINSAEVVLETIDYVLATGEPEKHRLIWSS